VKSTFISPGSKNYLTGTLSWNVAKKATGQGS
jgi:hypothetical protein